MKFSTVFYPQRHISQYFAIIPSTSATILGNIIAPLTIFAGPIDGLNSTPLYWLIISQKYRKHHILFRFYFSVENTAYEPRL